MSIQKIEKSESVLIHIGFESLSAIATFIDDKRNGRLQSYFRPIEQAVRRIHGYEEFTLNVSIRQEDYLTFCTQLGNM